MSSETLNPTTTAIVFIEYQNEFTTEGGKLHDAVKNSMASNKMLENSKKVLDFARAHNILVIHEAIYFSGDYREIKNVTFGTLAACKGGAFAEGSWGAAICDTMKPQTETEHVIRKTGLCGFSTTNLDFVLRANGIQTVAIGGFLANCCVEGTLRIAYEKGYHVVALSDCVAATSLEALDATIKYNYPHYSVPLTSDEFLSKLTA
ncbi:isochorismatase hydrolase, putative [Bodo saltans]|uniref:Isochorismatase hydrolase, putative n=1 Tax=Bodo saltans TaxID=75058 RepID=A0A0S4ISZ0_BODSA|nr:isochorismatase hydrolase, putative [Bodo saltans]|eukprot:CUG06273.1 isochorismatase hydrolase, putative [Bodo saltans]